MSENKNTDTSSLHNTIVKLDDDASSRNGRKRDAYDRWQKKEERRATRSERLDKFFKVYKFIRPFIVAAACILIAFFLVSAIVKKVMRDYFLPVDPNDPSPIVVEIPSGSGASAIAKILYEACGEGEKGLISHKAVFKIYVDFIGKANRLQSGTYVLSKNMSIPEIVDVICKGNPPRETLTFSISEGLTIEAIADRLVSQGVIETPDEFLSLCVTGEEFVKNHPFISEIPEDPTGERRYALEGFLFPATYEIYADADVKTVIGKMLTKYEQVFGVIYTARAEELGLSFYEVITLASIVEKEAKPIDFADVSAVFHNRLERNMGLGSDATLRYILDTDTSTGLTQEQLNTPSGYNTHLNTGIPIGPICNPGDAAINAVLYPSEEGIAENYLYFCLMDPTTGKLVFARTLEEHNANIAQYSPLW